MKKLILFSLLSSFLFSDNIVDPDNCAAKNINWVVSSHSQYTDIPTIYTSEGTYSWYSNSCEYKTVSIVTNYNSKTDTYDLDYTTYIVSLVPLVVCKENEYNDGTQCIYKCPVGTIYNESNDSCSYSPTGDYDNDGIINSLDNDIDGDSIPNDFDDHIGAGTTNGNGTNQPDGSFLEGTPTCDDLLSASASKCSNKNYMLNFKCNTTSNGFAYVVQNQCIEIKNPCDKIKLDFSLSCKSPKVIEGDCSYDSTTNQLTNLLDCVTPDPDLSPCEIARANLLKTCIAPNYIAGYCQDSYGTLVSNSLYCKVVDTSTPQVSNNSTGSDLNITSSNTTISNIPGQSNQLDLTPLISENNRNFESLNTIIENLESETRGTNSQLSGINSKLSTLIDMQNRDNNNKIDNENLKRIKDNTKKTNDLLKDLKDLNGSVSQGISSFDTSIVDLNQTDLDSMQATGNLFDNLADNVGFVTADIVSIKEQFVDLESLLKGDKTTMQISTCGCSNNLIVKFGKIIEPYSAPFAIVTYISVMLSIFRLVFIYLSKGD